MTLPPKRSKPAAASMSLIPCVYSSCCMHLCTETSEEQNGRLVGFPLMMSDRHFLFTCNCLSWPRFRAVLLIFCILFKSPLVPLHVSHSITALLVTPPSENIQLSMLSSCMAFLQNCLFLLGRGGGTKTNWSCCFISCSMGRTTQCVHWC